MSTFLAIGGVSATLQKLLKDRMELPSDVAWSDVDVTVRTPKPDADPNDPQTPEGARVNLFLYNVTESLFLKNQEIPGRGHPGTYGHPPLSVDLHYLLTAYGTTSENGSVVTEVRAQQLLGSAMQVLHDHPVITDKLLADDGTAMLHPTLLGEYERVKLTLNPISLEDLSKVWTALTFPYRLSVAYKVSVVQIESTQPRSFPKLVGKPPEEGPRVVAVPLRGPRINELLVSRIEAPEVLHSVPYARIGDTLVLKGSNLGGSTTRVFIGAVDASGEISSMSDSQIFVRVPDEPELQPGTQTVYVAQDVLLGEPPVQHKGFRSNVAAFVLVPGLNVQSPPSVYEDTWTLTIEGSRLYHKALSGEVIIGETAILKSDYVGAPSSNLVEVNLPSPSAWSAWGVDVLESADCQATVDLSFADPRLVVTIGADGPRVVKLGLGTDEKDRTLEDLGLALGTPLDAFPLLSVPELLQSALRRTSESEAFQTVSVVGIGQRLYVLSVGTGDAIAIRAQTTGEGEAPDTETASRLGLDDGAAKSWDAFLSGVITEVPTLTAGSQLRVEVDGTPDEINPDDTLSSLDSIAAWISSKVEEVALAYVAEDRLVLLFDDLVESVVFEATPSDLTTAGLLHLESVRLPVRVRVNGAESLEQVEVVLP